MLMHLTITVEESYMFTEPLSLAKDLTGTNNVSVSRISMSDGASRWINEDESLALRISHQKTKTRIRRMLRVDRASSLPDAITGVSKTQTASAYIVLDEPTGSVYSDAELTELLMMVGCAIIDAPVIGKFLTSQT